MLSKCANPGCPATFLYLHQGKLFRVENEASDSENLDPHNKRPAQRVEFFWLCADCAVTMTLKYKKGVGITTAPVAQTMTVAQFQPEKPGPPLDRAPATGEVRAAQAAALGS